MSTITRERLQWLANISGRDDIEDIDGGEIRELARIALAAQASRTVYQWRERYEEGHFWDDCTKEQYEGFAKRPDVETRILYTAPPAPVSVPAELTREEYKRRFMEEDEFDDTFRGGWNACRAAMLQGAEPVTTAYKLPELTDSQCLEFLAVAFRHARIKGDIECDDIRLGLKLALEAAPQQEVR